MTLSVHGPSCTGKICLWFFSAQVSVVKSEETKMRQEDLSRLLYEVQILRSQQENMECQVQDMKQWVESYSGCFLWAFVSLEWWLVGNAWREEPCTLPFPGNQGLTRDLLRQQHVGFLCTPDLQNMDYFSASLSRLFSLHRWVKQREGQTGNVHNLGT